LHPIFLKCWISQRRKSNVLIFNVLSQIYFGKAY
jgi:hypothetical protein